jgi:hypothetical protein
MLIASSWAEETLVWLGFPGLESEESSEGEREGRGGSYHEVVNHENLAITASQLQLRVAQIGGEALCPMKALCPSVRECQGQESGVGGLVNRGREEEIGGDCFSEGKPGNRITFEM